MFGCNIILYLSSQTHRETSKITNKVYSTNSLHLSSRRSGETGDTLPAQYSIWCVVDHIGGNTAGGHYIVHIRTCAGYFILSIDICWNVVTFSCHIVYIAKRPFSVADGTHSELKQFLFSHGRPTTGTMVRCICV